MELCVSARHLMVNPTIGQAVNAKQSQQTDCACRRFRRRSSRCRAADYSAGGEQKQAAAGLPSTSLHRRGMAKRRVEPPRRESRVFAGARL